MPTEDTQMTHPVQRSHDYARLVDSIRRKLQSSKVGYDIWKS